MLNRRKFLKAGFLSSAVFVMGGCELFSVTTPMQTIQVLQYDLFPHAKELKVDVNKYFQIILKHSRIDEDSKKYIKNGVKWINEEAQELFGDTYIKLGSEQRQKVLKSIAKTSWGESYISTILTYIMEACFSSEVYGVSSGDSFTWLDFKEGFPHAKEALL